MSASIADLQPLFQPIAMRILDDCEVTLGKGLIRPAQTFRSMADQAAAKAAGKSQVSLGWHQFGLAMDVAILTPEGKYVTDGTDGRYTTFGMVAMKHGCVWGGSWTNPDYDHCEWHPGFKLADYVQWLDAHRIVTA